MRSRVPGSFLISSEFFQSLTAAAVGDRLKVTTLAQPGGTLKVNFAASIQLWALLVRIWPVLNSKYEFSKLRFAKICQNLSPALELGRALPWSSHKVPDGCI